MTSPLPALLADFKEGVIDLGWGHPSPRLLPVDAMGQAADRIFARGRTEPFQYGAAQGYGPFLEALAGFLSGQPSYGMRVDPRRLFLVAGASQGLDLACTLFARDGDTVLVEEPTYFVVEGILRAHRLDVRGVPTDENGLDVDALEEMLESGLVRPRLVYTIPSYHNPTGSVLPEERRRRLVELAHRYEFLVLADEVYQLLHFGDAPARPIIAFDDEEDGRTISFGSFSKILSPGLRVGWIQAAPGLIERFADAALSFSGGGLNHFVSALAREVIELGLLERNVVELREVYADRAAAMSYAIREHLGGLATYGEPSGGYYFWLRFPDSLDTAGLLPAAEEAGVWYRPGNAFSESGRFASYLRLTYTFYEKERLVEGVRRLADAFASERIG